MTDLEKLLAGIGLSQEQPEQNMSVGEPASFPSLEEAQVDAQNAQTNEMAKSPNLMTKSELVQKEAAKEADKTVTGQVEEQTQAQKVNPIEQYLQDRNSLIEKSQADIKEARVKDAKYKILADAIKSLGNIGAAQVQRQAGVKAGLKDFKETKGPDTASDIMKDRDVNLAKLQEDLRLLQSSKPKALSELDKKKLDIESRKLDLQGQRLEQDLKAPKQSPLSFEDKELVKARAKMKVENEKEQAKIRQANLKEKKAAEQSDKDLDEQLEKIKRAKKLMTEMVKQGGVSDTGPIDQYISGFGSKGQELRQSLNDLSLEKMAKLFSGMSKAVDSEAERKMFEQSQASMGNYPDVNMKILNEMEKGIQSLKGKNKNFIQRYDSTGKEISNEKIDVVLPDGRKGRIDADKVESFMKKYPNAQIM